VPYSVYHDVVIRSIKKARRSNRNQSFVSRDFLQRNSQRILKSFLFHKTALHFLFFILLFLLKRLFKNQCNLLVLLFDIASNGHGYGRRKFLLSLLVFALPLVFGRHCPHTEGKLPCSADEDVRQNLKSFKLLVSNARAQKTRESFKQIRERSVREKEGGKTQPNFTLDSIYWS
jgi:hypothetical protein